MSGDEPGPCDHTAVTMRRQRYHYLTRQADYKQVGKGSLWLLARSFNDAILDRATTEGTISDLLSSGMRLPCKNGTDFIPWAQSVGLIPQN